MTALRASGLGWTVGGTTVVEDVTFEVPAGSVVGLLGPNGSGKSTVLHLAAGLLRPTAGSSLVDGAVVQQLAPRNRARLLALVEQEAGTDLDLRVRDVVALGRGPHRGRWPGTDAGGEARVADALARTDVTHLADRRWSTLSGGERQRVQLARALAQEPRVLLLDEPTNHLDLHHQLELMRLVRASGTTVLAALHDLDLAATFCDRLVVLDEGRVVADGTPDDVLTADLLRKVYDVEAQVVPHPVTGGPLVVWDPAGASVGLRP